MDTIKIAFALADSKRLAVVQALAQQDLTAQELAAVMGVQSSAASYQLKLLTDAGIVYVHRSDFDGRESYFRLNGQMVQAYIDTLTRYVQPVIADRNELQVVFVCRANSARSQMAEAFVRAMGNAAIRVHSAGIHVSKIHPHTVQVMQEVGISMHSNTAKTVADIDITPQLVISVCDYARKVVATQWPAASYLHWSIADPAKTGTLHDFRVARDEIRQRVHQLFVPSAY